jgi:hypothetical protein
VQPGDRGAVAGEPERLQRASHAEPSSFLNAAGDLTAGRVDDQARSWSSPTTMSPLALVRPRHSPSEGVWQKRSPSTPGLGSS